VERPVGGRHARHRGDELQRFVLVRPRRQSPQRCPQGHRALLAGTGRPLAQLRGADRGPDDVHPALDDPHADLPPAGAEGPASRVQLRRVLGGAALRRPEEEDSGVGRRRRYTVCAGGSPVRTKLFSVIAGVVLIGATAAPLIAHHSFAAEFDVNKQVTIKGKVVKVEWVNPHSWIHVDVTGPDGKAETWAVEGAAPHSLIGGG